MDEEKKPHHTILLVDDERNVINSLKRLLRKENYTVLTAASGTEGLTLLEENEVHLVISDQRMPGMSGTEFLAEVKTRHPDTIRITLTGYTEVDAITEAINKGHIYKFLLKPWNDQNLKLEIKQALEQYDLIQANRKLHQKVLKKNTALKNMNENLENLVRERTESLEIQNQALELSQEILEDLPFPILGISSEGMIVLGNRQAQTFFSEEAKLGIGRQSKECFSSDVQELIDQVLSSQRSGTISNLYLSGISFELHCVPLSGKFQGRGVVVVLEKKDAENLER